MVLGKSVAIVAIGGEFPESPTLDRFWNNIVNRVDCAREAPEGRWLLDVDEAYDSEVGAADKVYSRKACFVDENAASNALDGLNIDAATYASFDPMVRLLLRVGRQVVADHAGTRLQTERGGIIIGNLALPSDSASQLSRFLLGQAFTSSFDQGPVSVPETLPPQHSRYVAGLPVAVLSKALGFGGTSFTVDAACASSLYAIKLAADELLSGRADVMLAGGLSRPDSLYTQMGFSQLRALSPSGTCAPFDANGNGLVVGEGCGLVMLKRLEDAERDADHIYAVIRGIGLSNDLEGNLLAPASEGQLRAMQSAYKQAGWQPADVDLIECHATGTPVGDKVEFGSLEALWKNSSWRPGQCVIGSVKSNIGHLLTAAGSAALIKTLLALKHGVLPPTANYSQPGNGIDLERSPFKILTKPSRWDNGRGKKRRAAVSAFGFGGINAHLLLEEWQPREKKSTHLASHPHFQAQTEPVAIVGMGTHFGPWEDLESFSQRAFGADDQVAAQPVDNWWGIEQSQWFKNQGYTKESFKGFLIPEVTAVAGEFKIPPTELVEMLPRQLLMLKVAGAALDDAGIDRDELLFTGIFIGCGLDLNATNFSFRWAMRRYARIWAAELGLELNAAEFEQWVGELRRSCGPALSANRVMGALGSVVASRIAKNFHIGGPSFTLSSEENSGLRALEAAVHSLQEGSINRALVGAVDLSSDLRNVLSHQQDYPASASGMLRAFDKSADGTLIGEGAAAVVLKRLSDARQDGDRVYAVIRGVGTAIGGDVDASLPSAEAFQRSLQQVSSQARTSVERISYIETDGCGVPHRDRFEADQLTRYIAQKGASKDCYIGSVKTDIGHTGGASGLAALVKTALCLDQGIVPGLRHNQQLIYDWVRSERSCSAPCETHYWLNNRADGARQALISGLGGEGSCSHLVLEEFDHQPKEMMSRPLGDLSEGLFAVQGTDVSGLIQQLGQLRVVASGQRQDSIDDLAALWNRDYPLQDTRGCLITLVASHKGELQALIAAAIKSLQKNPQQGIGSNGQQPLSPALRDRIFYSPKPLSKQGKVAFIFPGSGNHFAGMGRQLSARWPHIYRSQEQGSDYLADQYLPHLFWRKDLSPAIADDHNALVISHVAQCTALHDLLCSFNIRPNMVSGYSLGESSSLFSTGAWRDRDGMLKRLKDSDLFSAELGGECRAAHRTWGMAAHEKVDWVLGMVNLPAEQVRTVLSGVKRVYTLIINSYGETVIGGHRPDVEAVIKQLDCHFFPIDGVTTVHCEVTKAVADAYRALHLFDVNHPSGIDFYSCALGRKYPVSSENAADVILGQAVDTIDYPRVIEQLYADGARIFLESGPGSSCTRMISSILGDRPHMARAFCLPGQDSDGPLLRLLASALSEGIAVDLNRLYPTGLTEQPAEPKKSAILRIVAGGQSFEANIPEKKIVNTDHYDQQVKVEDKAVDEAPTAEIPAAIDAYSPVAIFNNTANAQLDAHRAYLDFSDGIQSALSVAIEQQSTLLQQMIASGNAIPTVAAMATAAQAPLAPVTTPVVAAPALAPAAVTKEVAFDRDLCMEFAIGSVAKMLGADFAEADSYPTRVRLPDEPLMLVDRILKVEGVPRSMTHGRVVTEHDVTADRWYLDGGRIPTCVAVESGQADLFLSGYLGIDFITKGKAVYRLLDAEVTFYRSLPVVGDVIHYDIKIDEFFRQDQTYLFRFSFEATVNGEHLMSMRKGCAGFFTAEELAAGKGIVHTKLDLMPQPGQRPDDWRDLTPLAVESYNEAQIDALYNGDLASCFGEVFANLPLQQPYTLPGGKLKLVDRVVKLDPQAGRYGLGQITAEMDIDPKDWFLTCHFVDDRVMPGTLMYECCLHTLRIYLMRMGWVGETGQTWCEPVPGVVSGLKCRGQVVESTKTVTYQVSIKELGYGPEPFAIVDALMYADGHPIVEIPDMSVRLAGLNRAAVEALWLGSSAAAPLAPDTSAARTVLYDTDRITAFSIGNPSEAFGEPYKVFDHERKIARLPGPPFQFIDRIVGVEGEPWKMVAGAATVAQYDVPADAWYFAQGRQPDMPFSVLLEIGLQPCGWLAAYCGSALTSPIDLSFRNLDGNAVQHRAVTSASGTLTIKAELTRVASSGGMIIQNYDFEVSDSVGVVYAGDTVFGFFSKESLAQQVGVRGSTPYQPDQAEQSRGESFPYPQVAPYPDTMMRMIDHIDLYVADGGPDGLGFVRGRKVVDPGEWFFKAHFYQDPVCPGSLGLESFLQLLKVAAAKRWGATEQTVFETVAIGEKQSWNYRGQIIPANDQVLVEAIITAADDEQRLLHADGFLSVDGKVIYQLKDFTLRMS